MVMTLERALSIVTHAGYNELSLPPLDYVNEAGKRLLSMHPWRWTIKPPVQIGLRAAEAFTGGTYTDATKTISNLTLSYTHANGDNVSITSGTGATVRDYTIASSTSTTLVLSESIGSGADGQTDIAGTINAGRAIVLPSDFGQGLTGYVTTQGLTQHIMLTSQQLLVQARTRQPAPPLGVYWASIFTAPDLSATGGAPTYRLEIYPDATAVHADFITVSYRIAWTDLTEDAKIISIPPWIEPLFTSIVRRVTRGYEEEEQGTVDQRIDELRVSSTFSDLVAYDGLIQPNYGELGQGDEQWYGQDWWPYPTQYVADP
jgi:hypothetical protein